ncbi:putative cysteine protease [Rhypophila decipiens]|uniref:Cysteine protease n=1 Tax=Rhypophila decipiens TaxID=261697 RepID=A0AAN6YHT9_9PEZI|nr:putative cysteine protease [Rhypophila decipiens]
MKPARPGSGSWQSAVSDTSPKIASAMEVAMAGAVAGAAEVSRVGRRILHKIWDPEPVNDRNANEPVWCLGCSYTLDTKNYGSPDLVANTPPTEGTDVPPLALETPPDSVASSFDSSLAYEEPGQDGGWPPAFLDDFESRIWMTYRSSFEIIPKSVDPRATAALSFSMRLKTSFGEHTGFSSDTGWGCMIRSGQSLLANAITIARLGRDWRRGTSPEVERDILSLFSDNARAPYSLHSFVKHGAAACGKYPGEWFGPSATARCIQTLANQRETSLRVYSTGDLPDVYEDSFMAVANPDGRGFQPTLILVCTRLGIDKINSVYHEALISTLQMPQSIGIAGGRPSSSLYFVGVQGKWLFYLDPHHPRPALPYRANPAEYTQEEVDSCHTRRLRSLHVEDMDPSMLIGFLIKDEDDWDTWKSSVKHVQGKAIITVSPHDPERGMGSGRAEAIDEVETLSDDDDADTILEI